ncbi:hypothetical protein JL721_9610 [Aureococcus anophagefferens]|nr:hypothetical protein JL721_9610 [Aureococcus anophagefferens]
MDAEILPVGAANAMEDEQNATEGEQHAMEDSDAEHNYGTPPDVVAAVEFFNELDGERTVVFGRAPSIASYVRTIVASEAATSASGAFAAEVAAAVHRAADAVKGAVGAQGGARRLLRRGREDATGGDVRRALKAQGMVDLIDFGDGSSGTLLGLLARTAAAPAFVKHAHGRSFVGGLLGGACEVDGTIERVYAPLLWRHLACPNATARKRAVTILAAAFPVVADTAKASKKEAVGLALEDQLERLRDALPRSLHDTAPRCRLAAANCLAAYAASRARRFGVALQGRHASRRENPKTTLALAKVLVDAYFPLKRHKDDAEAAPSR